MTRTTAAASTAIICALAMTLWACSDTDDEDDRVRDLRQRDLPVLVLPIDALGAVAAGFDIDVDSGPISNQDAAENSIDPSRTADDYEEAGRIAGYELTYANPNPEAATAILQISTGVSLWEDADSASEALERNVSEIEAREGEDIDGLRLVAVERFEIDDIGDEAIGIVSQFDFPGVGVVFGTAIYSRIDRLGMTTAIISLGTEYEADARRIAEAHVSWVEQVLDGEIDPTPVALPDDTLPPDIPTEEPGDFGALAGVALQPSDLPTGFIVVNEFNDPAGAGIADFTREFESDDAFTTVGTSDITNIQNNIIVFSSAVEARAFLTSVAALLEGDAGADFLRGFLEQEGVFPDSLTTERLDEDLGDETVIIVAEAETAVADFVLVYALTRSETVVSAFIVVGDRDQFDLEDIRSLAELVLDRLIASEIQ